METEQKFVVWAVLLLMLLSLISLGGCDYWPPALQAELAQLREQLSDALDEQAKLSEELAELQSKTASYRNAGSDGGGSPARHPNVLQSDHRTEGPAAVPPLAEATESFGSLRGEPAPRPVVRGSMPTLRLEHPHQKGPAVAQLQRWLRQRRMPVHVDGVYGPETAAAVRSFQRAHRLPADGIAGPATQTALRRTAPPLWRTRPVRLQEGAR